MSASHPPLGGRKPRPCRQHDRNPGRARPDPRSFETSRIPPGKQASRKIGRLSLESGPGSCRPGISNEWSPGVCWWLGVQALSREIRRGKETLFNELRASAAISNWSCNALTVEVVIPRAIPPHAGPFLGEWSPARRPSKWLAAPPLAQAAIQELAGRASIVTPRYSMHPANESKIKAVERLRQQEKQANPVMKSTTLDPRASRRKIPQKVQPLARCRVKRLGIRPVSVATAT